MSEIAALEEALARGYTTWVFGDPLSDLDLGALETIVAAARRELARMKSRVCENCGGTGHVTEHCGDEFCGGCDDPECVQLDEHPCPSCGGSGEATSPVGSGLKGPPSPQEIRKAVVDSTCESCPDMVDGGMERVIEARALLRDVALDYADHLEAGVKGPSDEDYEDVWDGGSDIGMNMGDAVEEGE